MKVIHQNIIGNNNLKFYNKLYLRFDRLLFSKYIKSIKKTAAKNNNFSFIVESFGKSIRNLSASVNYIINNKIQFLEIIQNIIYIFYLLDMVHQFLLFYIQFYYIKILVMYNTYHIEMNYL